jgi:hypothetical protein
LPPRAISHDKTLTDLQLAARAHDRGQYVEARGPQPRYIIAASTVETADGSLNTPLLIEAADAPTAQ